MPDHRAHRGPHPEDLRLFGPERIPSLQKAAADLSWLLDQGYPRESSTKLVGDKFALTDRQRSAIGRVACTEFERTQRMKKERAPLYGEPVLVDAFNILTTLECALSGAVVLRGRDSSIRDIASVRGTWRRVEETVPALRLIQQAHQPGEAGRFIFLIDKPVSNSGRLAGIIRDLAKDGNLAWEAETVPDPDAVLCKAGELVVTSDSLVLDDCRAWHNMTGLILSRLPRPAWLLDLTGPDASTPPCPPCTPR